jgi:TetR/AcrR family transcriptional regulator, transcriptional repressor for nem operon
VTKPRSAPGTAGAEQDTAGRILDVAERLVQERGFNGFSYADIATELQVTKPALHYHFPTKVDLGTALIARYSERFANALAGLDASDAEPPAKLRGYSDLYLSVLREQRMCLCGMLAAEYQTLPDPMRAGVLAFFDLNEVWLVDVLEAGRDDGSLGFGGSTRDTARTVISCLEGAMLYARPHQDTSRFEGAAAQLLAALESPARI